MLDFVTKPASMSTVCGLNRPCRRRELQLTLLIKVVSSLFREENSFEPDQIADSSR